MFTKTMHAHSKACFRGIWMKFDSASGSIIALEALLVAMLFTSFLIAIFQEGFFAAFAALQAALVIVYLLALFVFVRKHYAKEFWKYALFFVVLAVFVNSAWIVRFFGAKKATEYTNYFLLIVAAMLVFVLLFRLLLGKRHATGKVLFSEGGTAVVQTDFDLLSFTNAGKYVVKTKKKLKKGQTVKLKTGVGLFYTKPKEAIE